jgi:putative copper export protein
MNLNWEVLFQVLHDLAFAAYVGGLFYAEIVLTPAAGSVAPAQGAMVMRKAGDRQMIISWSALLVILVTGALRLGYMHLLAFPGSFFLKHATATSAYGQTIFAMFGLWCVLAALGLAATFRLRPMLIGKIDPTLSQAEREARQERMMGAARWMSIVMRADLAVAVVIAVLGVSLASGGLV